MSRNEFLATIGGAGGKGGRQRTPKEAKDSLRSRQLARVIDLISEGPIKGLVGGMQGVFIDGVALENKDGSTNFDNVNIQQNLGYPNQPIMKGFPSIVQEVPMGPELTYGKPLTAKIINTDVDRCRITVSVPILQQTYPKSGDTVGAKVSYRIEVQNNGGGYKSQGTFTIDGKTTSKYQRANTIDLHSPGPWDLRVIRTTGDSTSSLLQNDLYWDSYTEITDDRINYSGSALIGIVIDAEQFSSIPNRAYLIDGLLCRIPKNYDPVKHTYSGTWDGTFKTDWTDNPAWVFYDILTQRRYGLGEFMPASLTDKWTLYNIGKYCDELVPNGHGGQERRYACNIQIRDQMEAYDLLQRMASIFHGWTYWSGNLIKSGADMPEDPSVQFTNANVIDGVFTYSGGDIRQKHTVAAVSWSDPKRLGDVRVSVVEADQAAISRYGIQRLDLEGVGITSEGQAQRMASWAIYGEQYEADKITFKTSFEGNIAPGKIAKVMDATISGKRRGGRVKEGSTTTRIFFDADIGTTSPSSTAYLSCLVGSSATLQVKRVTSVTGGATPHADMADPFTAAPVIDGTFVLTETPTLEASLWRLTDISQVEPHVYELIGTRHLPSKYGYIEKGKPLVIPDVSDVTLFPPPVSNLKVIEYLVETSPISVGVRGTLSWTSKAPSFDVAYRNVDGNWTKIRTDHQAYDFPATEGKFTFQVIPVGVTGMKGAVATLNYEFIGRFALPDEPKQFRINVVNGVALFDWLPAPEIDVVIGGHYELRFSAAVANVNWASAQTAIPSIPGNSTHCEIAYQPGTWMLRTFDITGRSSKTWASIVGVIGDASYFAWERICENPDWSGTHNNTKELMPQEWLTIATVNGGKWDDQDWWMLDQWGLVDELPTIEGGEPGINVGVYTFDDRLDAGGAFSVRLSADMLAFPYSIPDDWIDSRSVFCDKWEDWDESANDYEGEAIIMMRTTLNDPASGSAVWTEWKTFIAGEHYARGFEFQVVLIAPYGQNIGIETLCILGDFRNKYEEGMDVPYTGGAKVVTLKLKYYHPPAVVVTVQDAEPSDKITITGKSNTTFTVTMTNSGAPINSGNPRSFDWHSQGY